MKESVDQLLEFFKKHKYAKIGLFILAAGLVTSSVMLYQAKPKAEPIALSDVATAIAAGEVEKIEESQELGELTIYYKDGSEDTALKDKTAPFLEQMRYLGVNENKLSHLEYEVVTSKALSGEKTFSAIISLSILGMATFALMRFSGGGVMAVRKKYVEGAIPDTTFKDVAGVDECREELVDIVTFLKGSEQYERMGARMPHGVLLVGDPGTGKTLLAKAIAGEAGVPFFATSGSEFVEMFVGVGAGRVRTLFRKARSKAPCIVFIDEIDAVGRKRHSSGGGGEMEQDQTLNQLLVEMDGFSPSDGVVVLAATNRTDVLDSALTRSGRFDRHVSVPHPDVRGRLSILQVHVDGRSLAPDVNLMDVAKSTPGLVGADLANIVNEAAIQAVRNNTKPSPCRIFKKRSKRL
jgi:cell division protease FtsH